MTFAPLSNAVATAVARLETDEEGARRIADLLIESHAADEIAVALSDACDGRWRVAIYFRTAPHEDPVRTLVAAAAGREMAATLRFERMAATDWVRESLLGLTPVAAGGFVVHGAHDRGHIPVNRIGIEIEAALAFGTGHHGTTRGCLLALDRLCRSLSARRRRLRILDLGTGSGVLAIAAARALRQGVLATDIDSSALQAARANARLNRLGALIEVVKAAGVTGLRLRKRAPFDLVFANVLLRPLQGMAVPLQRLIAPGARVILSGLLPAQANAALAAYRSVALERRIEIEGWTTLALTRRRRRMQRHSAVARRHPAS